MEGDDQLFAAVNQADSAGVVGMIMSMMDSVMTGITNAGYSLEGPIEVYIEEDKKKK